MTSKVIEKYGITEVLHFTTRNGALGVLSTGMLLPHSQLKAEERIEFILKKNCEVRKDPAWAGHSSMSITRINARFFEFSKAQHDHEIDLWWCILAFDPAILTHPNVVFCTGNNTWPRTLRGKGPLALEAMFADSVPGRWNSVVQRPQEMLANVPTCDQAEVLYPGSLSIQQLTRAYFQEQDHADHFLAMASALSLELSTDIVAVAPEKFRGIE